MPSVPTSASPLSRMLAAMRVKSPFSHRALFGFIGALQSLFVAPTAAPVDCAASTVLIVLKHCPHFGRQPSEECTCVTRRALY